LPINSFTLIGATTKSGMISAPLRSRFGITERLDYYADEDLAAIVSQTARFLGMDLTLDASLRIAKCARGTPRVAKKIVRRVRDFAQVHNKSTDEAVVQQSLAFLGLDEEGLTKIDHLILKTIVDSFNGGPVGLETLASMVGEDKDTLETVYEPFLMRKGYLEKTPRGRQIPHKKLMQLKLQVNGQQKLF
jgi:Holliday junction DNA helicase RuvB